MAGTLRKIKTISKFTIKELYFTEHDVPQEVTVFLNVLMTRVKRLNKGKKINKNITIKENEMKTEEKRLSKVEIVSLIQR